MRYKISKSDFVELLKTLMEKDIVSSVLSGEEKKNRFSINPKLIDKADDITDFPLSQLMVYNYNLTHSAANFIRTKSLKPNEKVALIGHACDIRALIENDKKKQVDFDSLFLIGFEDTGYLGGKDKRMFFKKQKIDDSQIIYERLTPTDFIIKYKDGKVEKFPLGEKIDINKNCRCCNRKIHPASDIVISTYGLPEDSEMFILTPLSESGKVLIDDLNWNSKKIDDNLENKYITIAKKLVEASTEEAQKDLEWWNSLPIEEKITYYDKCTACGMCVRSCPVCFCKVCTLHEKSKSGEIARRTFILNRFSHVGDTCISCGKCELNCPFGIPLTTVFRGIQQKMKEQRKYMAGENRKTKSFKLDY